MRAVAVLLLLTLTSTLTGCSLGVVTVSDGANPRVPAACTADDGLPDNDEGGVFFGGLIMGAGGYLLATACEYCSGDEEAGKTVLAAGAVIAGLYALAARYGYGA